MLDKLKEQVCRANVELGAEGLVIQTFGNVSGIDRERNLVAIKPSGVAYEALRPNQIVVVSLETGQPVEGDLKPSSDTPTHLELYRAFGSIGGIAHTHSTCATAWAQARREILPLGTTHADYFHGPVPCTRPMTAAEIKTDYEANTGKVIVERFAELDPLEFPGALVANHGPFTWGTDAIQAVHAASALEHLARLAAETLRIEPGTGAISTELLDKHFLRKHGPDSYYGQGRGNG
jgi:L-ribulose-5-phosphate 4-epimerase